MTNSRPFRFGVIGENAATPAALLDTAQRAERLGYATFLLRDHFIREPFGDQLAPMPALGAVAAATRHLRVGTLVLANDYRHPVMLAKETATLDALSGGRFELGLGAGWLREEYERAGLAFDAPGVRVDRLAEAITIISGLLGGKSVRHDGDLYRVRDLTTYPPTEQRPRPPILVGAGSKRMLQLAGRTADIVGILPKALPEGTISEALAERTPETMDAKIDWLREAAGPRFSGIELSMMISPQVTDDVDGTAEQYAARRGWDGLSADSVLQLPGVFLGSVERIAETMRERRERYGFSYYVVSDAVMDRFAPVVERLTRGEP